MTRDDALATLRAAREALHERHVMRAAVFGSVARGEATAESDLDILIEFAPEAPVSVWDFVGVKHAVADLFTGQQVDVVDRAGLNRHVRPYIEREAVYAF